MNTVWVVLLGITVGIVIGLVLLVVISIVWSLVMAMADHFFPPSTVHKNERRRGP